MNVRQVIPADAIPSVDDPTFQTGYDGNPDDEVIVVGPEQGPARAYPIRFLHYHEIVNDEIDETPIAVTWCPLCGSAVVYERRVNGTTLTFGVSGKLADDDLVMYDRETDSEWKQSLGECFAGEYEGQSLDVLPATMCSWKQFDETHPDGVTMAPSGGTSEASSDTDEPAPIEYGDEPYARYFEMEGFGLDAHRGGESRDWNRDDLDPKAVVLGIEHDGDALGFPLPRVRDADSVAHASVNGLNVVVFATADGLQAFENPGYSFDSTAQPGVFKADDARWNGISGECNDGRTLEPVAAQWLFAFTWQDDHGPDSFWEE